MALKRMDEIEDRANRWFGPSWGAPVNEPDLEIAVPVGEPCAYCDEPFVEGDQGMSMMHVEMVNPSDLRHDELVARIRLVGEDSVMESFFVGRHKAEHYECRMVSVVGHVLCQLTHGPAGVCPTGDRDPPGLTRRESARLAVAIYEMRQRGQFPLRYLQPEQALTFIQDWLRRSRQN